QERQLRQVIDAEIKSGWEMKKITPAARASDSVFLRRVYLDLAGVIPSYEDTTAFLKDDDAHKRDKLIAKLLKDPRYAKQQAHGGDLALLGRHRQTISETRKRDSFTKWLADRFARNEPYDSIVRKLLTAEEDGSQLFYVQYRNAPEEAATAV